MKKLLLVFILICSGCLSGQVKDKVTYRIATKKNSLEQL
jgi:hypothetical protein